MFARSTVDAPCTGWFRRTARLAALGTLLGFGSHAAADVVGYDQMSGEPSAAWLILGGGGSLASTGNRYLGVPITLGAGSTTTITGFDTTLANNTGATFTVPVGGSIRLNYWIYNTWTPSTTTAPAFTTLAGAGTSTFGPLTTAYSLTANQFGFFCVAASPGAGIVPPASATPGVNIVPVTVSSTGPVGIVLAWSVATTTGGPFNTVGGLTQIATGGGVAPSVGTNAFGGAGLGYYRSAGAETNGNFLGTSARPGGVGNNSGLLLRVYTTAPAVGACCKADGTCGDAMTAVACAPIGVYQGDTSLCSGVTCPASIGSCCTGLACAVTDSGSCASGFTPAGTCTVNLCAKPCCDVNTGACSLVASGDACGGVVGSAGAACGTIACAAPANDLCTNPQIIPGAGPFPVSVLGQNLTSTDTAVLTPAICAASSRDVWYSFTPTTAAAYSFTLCNTVSGTLDTMLSIHSACPGATTNLDTSLATNCNDDGCSGTGGPSAIGGLTLTPGVTYLIRVAMWNTTAGGPFRLDITTEPFGACCSPTSGCSLKVQSLCTGTSYFVGGGSLCSTTSICDGACCVAATGVCTVTTAATCGTGTFGGVGSACSQTTCPSSTCCNDTTGVCTVTGTAGCTAGSTPHVDTACSPTLCPSDGACCANDGTCSFVSAASCATTSLFQGVGQACGAGNTCPIPAIACCNDSTAVCTYTAGATCPSGSHSGGTASVCSPNTCVATAYCAAGSPACGTANNDERISHVTFNTIDVDYGTGAGPAGCYNDFTSTSTTVFNGLSYTLTVTNAGAYTSDQCTVWFDWDNNFLFGDVASGEQFNLTQSGGGATFTGSIPVPLTASAGAHRMRIRLMFTGTPAPCGNATYGMVNDYSVDVAVPTFGACCYSDGTCLSQLPIDCTGLFQSAGSSCTGLGGTCPNTVTACCNTTTAACTFVAGTTCASGSVAFGSVCSPNACPTTGACCNADGTCTVDLPAACASPNLFQTLGTTCSGAGSTCPVPVTACCNAISGACSFVNGATCPSGTATGSVCVANPCVGLPGIVQNFDGSAALPSCYTTNSTGAGAPWAIDTTVSHSASNSVFTNNVGSTSSQFLTLPTYTVTGSPVVLDFWTRFSTECTYDGYVVEASVNGGPFTNIGLAAWTLLGYNDVIDTFDTSVIAGQDAFTCTTNDFASGLTWFNMQANIPGVALNDTVTLRFHMASDSSFSGTGVWLDDITVANVAANGSCCDTAGVCSYIPSAACTGAWTAACTCTPNPCTQPQVGICCLTTGVCATATPGNPLTTNTASCASGTLTVNGTCTPNTCPQPPAGVCCRGATCSMAFADLAACGAATTTSATGGPAYAFVSTALPCNAGVLVDGNYSGALTSTQSPCCFANYNHSPGPSGLEVQDIFDFLNDWFAGRAIAIPGGDGTSLNGLAVQNIFNFLNAWFAGGCS